MTTKTRTKTEKAEKTEPKGRSETKGRKRRPIELIPPVWARLELKDPDLFRLQRMRENLGPERVSLRGIGTACDEVERCTGRSTRMIFDLLEALEQRPDQEVIIVGHTHEHARRFCHIARDYAAALGLRPDRIISTGMLVPVWTGSRCEIFRDHACNEVRQEEKQEKQEKWSKR